MQIAEKAAVRKYVPFVAAFVVGLIFVLDITTPPHFAIWMLYAVPILSVSLLYRERYTYLITISSSILTVIGFFFPLPAENWRIIATLNRSIGLSVLWLIATIAALRKKTRDKMIQQTERAFEAERLKSRFLTDASHELRTPLAVIQSNIDLSLGKKSRKVTDPYRALRQIRKETDHMSKIIDRLGAAIQSGARAPDKTSFAKMDVAGVISRVISRHRPIADKKSIKFHTALAPSFFVHGDTEELETMFGNIIENAIKYGEAGSWIRIETTRSGNVVKINIADNGIGIPPEELPYVFERFYRAENHGGKKGSGLGLAIAKSVAEEHSGSISVSSSAAETVFSIKLPLTDSQSPQSG